MHVVRKRIYASRYARNANSATVIRYKYFSLASENRERRIHIENRFHNPLRNWYDLASRILREGILWMDDMSTLHPVLPSIISVDSAEKNAVISLRMLEKFPPLVILAFETAIFGAVRVRNTGNVRNTTMRHLDGIDGIIQLQSCCKIINLNARYCNEL